MIGNSGSGSSKDVSVPRIDIGQARLDTCTEEHSDILPENGFVCDSPKVGRPHQIHNDRRCTSGGTISEAVSQWQISRKGPIQGGQALPACHTLRQDGFRGKRDTTKIEKEALLDRTYVIRKSRRV